MESATDVLLAPEAECIVQALRYFKIEQVGGALWNTQHDYMEKLNMQAAICATQQRDEYIKEFIITYEKLPLLVHDLILTEIWRQNVFPEILKLTPEPTVTFPIYLVLYHEATVINLLETIMYHNDSMLAIEECGMDLLDYCYRRVLFLAENLSYEEKYQLVTLKNSYKAAENNGEELKRQENVLRFEIAIKSISIVRYFTDHIDSLSVSLTTRLLNTYDFPLLLVTLVEQPPWSVEHGNEFYRFVDSSWRAVDLSDRLLLSKVAGQVWITLYQLLMNQECQRKYELNAHRLAVILKLRSYLTEVLLDQMPALADLRIFLEQLALVEPPAPRHQLILEAVPELYTTLLQCGKSTKGSWHGIAQKQLKENFDLSTVELQQRAQGWAATYNLDLLESLASSEPPKCVNCGNAAAKRCSRCRNEWYCGRECQVGHWKKHKAICNLHFEAADKNGK